MALIEIDDPFGGVVHSASQTRDPALHEPHACFATVELAPRIWLRERGPHVSQAQHVNRASRR